MNKEILSKVAETFLDEPYVFTVNVSKKVYSSWWKRLLKKHVIETEAVEFKITGAKVPTMVRCSKLLLSIQNTVIPDKNQLEWAYNLIDQEAIKTAEIIATVIHNDISEVPKSLKDTISNNLTAAQLKHVGAIAIEKINVTDFIDCIDILRGMQVLEEVSTPVQTEEKTIASGDL